MTVGGDPAPAARPRILLLDTDLETRNHYIVLAIRDALARHKEVGAVILAGMLDAIALFRTERCDHFIAFGSARPQAPVLARLCAMARRSVLWTTEDPYELAANVACSLCFDHVFTNDLGCVPAYGGRAEHLPLAASLLFQDLPVLEDDAAYRYDLMFVGTAWPNRVAAIDRILGRFPGLRAKIGLSTNPHLPPVRLSRSGLWTEWRTSNRQFARLANVSRVTLGLERRFSAADAGQAKGSTPPPRLFEVALAGGYQVFLADGTEAAQYFEPGGEFALCQDLPAVIDEIGWALAHPADRMARARAARDRARRAHLYDHRVAELLRAFEAAPARRAADEGRTRRVLVVTHNVAGREKGGGVEVYQELLRRIGARFQILFLYPETVDDRTAFVVRHQGGEADRYDLPYKIPDQLLHDAAAETLFQRILFEFRIDLVHYQHLLHFPLSLPIISHASGVPCLFTLHDYYLICSQLNLLDYRGVYCDPAGIDAATCDICLNAKANLPAGSQTRRRNFIRQVLRAVDLVVANTPWSLDYLSRVYPELSAARATVLEMCLPAAPPRRAPAGPREGCLTVVIPGNFTEAKGGHQLVRLFNLMRGDAVRFTVLGALDAPFPDIFAALRFPNVAVRGGYGSAEIFGLLTGQDVSLHLSIWPETYVISLSEAWAGGLVPIVSRLGALGERVSDGIDGFVVDPYDLGRIAALLRRFAENRDALAPLAAVIADKNLVSPAEHLSQLRDLYERLIQAHPVRHAAPDGAALNCHLATADLGIRTNSARWDVEENVWDETLAAPPRDAAPLGARPPDLPVSLAGAPDRTRFSLDLLAVDDSPAREAIAIAAVGAPHVLHVAGWCYRPAHRPPSRRFLRLRRAGFSRDYPTADVARPDIAECFADQAGAAAGFSADLPLDSLPGGVFWLDLRTVYDSDILDYLQIARLDLVADDQVAARRARPALDGQRLDRLPATYETLPTLTIGPPRPPSVRASLDEWQGDGGANEAGAALLSAGAAQTLRLTGWAFHPEAGLPVDIFCRLRGPDREDLFALGVRRRVDVVADVGSERACEGGFAATLTGMALPLGPHRLDLLQVYDRQIVEFRDVARLLVVPRALEAPKDIPSEAP